MKLRLIVILLKFSQFSTFVLFYIDTLDKARRFCGSMRVTLILKLSTSDKIFMVVYIVSGKFTIGATKTEMSPISPVFELKGKGFYLMS